MVVTSQMKQYGNETGTDCEVVGIFHSTRCPACNYDLRGNVNAYECPECGFACEPGAIWLRPSMVRKHLRALAMLVVLALLVWIWSIEASRGFATWHPYGAVSLTAALVWPLLFFYRHYLKYCFPYEFIGIGTKRIHWRLSGHPEFAINWTEIDKVSYSVFFNQVALTLCRSQRLVRIPRRLKPRFMQLSEFASIVQRRWQKASEGREPDGPAHCVPRAMTDHSPKSERAPGRVV